MVAKKGASTSGSPEFAEAGDDFSWIKRELNRQGKKSYQLAKHLGCHPTRVSKIIRGKYNLKNLEIDRIRSFLGMGSTSHGDPNALDAHVVRVVGTAAEGVFVDPMNARFKPLRESVQSPETAKWGQHRYALELVEPIEPSPRVESEWVICVPMRHVKRKLEPDDLVHIDIQEGRLKATVVRCVQRNRAGELVFATIPNRGAALPPSTKVQGLVVGRGISMR